MGNAISLFPALFGQRTSAPAAAALPVQAAPAVAPAKSATQIQSVGDYASFSPANRAALQAAQTELTTMQTSLKSLAKTLSDREAAKPAPPIAVAPVPAPAPAPTPKPAPAPTPAPAPKPSAAEPWSPGAGQLHGADTSSWQSTSTFNAAIQGAPFSIIKASQGTGFVDPTFKARWDQLGKAVSDGSMKLRMAYCYLDSGDGVGQAKHFLDTVGVSGPLPAGTRLMLDWEASALNSPGTLKDAANYIHQVTGTWPVIYVQGSKMAVAQSTVPEAPIFQANWSSNIKTNTPFVQYSDGPSYDHDVFNGSMAALAKFAGSA
jgi:GH25 family lysozyme M1 (1,4-beta-N-acetylmuramidase)